MLSSSTGLENYDSSSKTEHIIRGTHENILDRIPTGKNRKELGKLVKTGVKNRW